MKLRYLILALFAGLAFGQSGTTAVTAQVRDANGSLYVNCQWSVVFLGENTTPGGGPYAPANLLVGQQGNCDSQANLSVNLADNISTVTPTPSQWVFSICSATGYVPGGTYCKANMPVTIQGATQDLSATFAVQMPILPISGSNTCSAVTPGVIPQATSSSCLGNSSPILDNGNTTPNQLTYQGQGFNIQSDGVHPGLFTMNGNTTPTTIPSNTAGFMGPPLASFTKYACQFPSTPPANQVLQCATPDGNGTSIGSWVSAGGGGGGNVFTAPVGAQNIVQPVSGSTTTQFTVNNFAGFRYVTATFNFSFTDSAGSIGNLSSAGSGKTLTLPSCPVGIDVSNNTLAPYYVEIGTTGTPEAALVTGGTCTTGAASGNIVVTTVNTHSAGFTVASSTAGIQEAINDAQSMVNNGQGVQVFLQPMVTSGTPNYTVNAEIWLKSGKSKLSGYGALVLCNTRSACVGVGNLAATAGANAVIEGIEFTPGTNVDGVQISSVAASSGTYTITTATAHPFVTGDYVTVHYSTPAQSQDVLLPITVTGANTFTYSVGANTFSSSSGFGWAALQNMAIWDITQEVEIRDVRLKTGTSSGRFSWGIGNNNDQNLKIYNFNNEGSGQVIKCTSNFCGAMYYGRGDSGAAGIASINDSELSTQCGGNGIYNVPGNTLAVTNTVIQGFAQYGVSYAPNGGLNPWKSDFIYNEVGGCTNPFYPGSLAAEAGIVTNNNLTIVGQAPFTGSFPSFLAANVGAQQNNYFVVIRSTGQGVGPMMYIGSCLTTGTGNCTTYWPEPNLDTLGTVTYDVLVTVGASAIPPYASVANSVATAISGSCTTNGICTFVDPQTGTTPYTVPGQQFAPILWFWPGSLVLGKSAKVFVDACPSASSIIPTTYSASVFARQEIAVGSAGASNPTWCVAQSGDSVGNNNPLVGAVLHPSGIAAGPATASLKGFYNFLNVSSFVATDIITLADSSPFKTLATPWYRPSWDANDAAIGFDQGTTAASLGVYLRAGTSVSSYIGSTGDNSSFKERLTSALKTFKVPISGSSYFDSTEISAPANPASGVERCYADSTLHQRICLNSSGGQVNVAPGSNNAFTGSNTSAGSFDKTGQSAIIADSAGINNTETVVTQSSVLATNRLQAGTVIRCTAWGTTTDTAANASTFQVRIGTTGTTADTSAFSASTAVSGTTGINVQFQTEIDLTIRSAGASATLDGRQSVASGNNGIQGSTASALLSPTVNTFNSTTANFVSLTYVTAAATTTSTFKQAFCEIVNK